MFIRNNSAASFTSLNLGLGTFGSGLMGSLLPNENGPAGFSARAVTMDSVINISLTAAFSSSGTFAPGSSLQFIVPLSGLSASRAVVLDSVLANYKLTFTNEYNITDSLNVKYLDINKGFFLYSATNYMNADLQLSVVHRNLWRTDFCLGHIPPLNSVSDLVGLTRVDSMNAYGGDVTPGLVNFPAGTVSKFSKMNISGIRMFPEWDPVTKKSVTKIDYCMNVAVMNKRIALSASDSFAFTIKTTSFKYSELSGTVMEPYKRSSDSVRFAIPASWIAGPVPENFFCDYFMAVKMPDSAKIDTLVSAQNMFSAKAPDSACQWSVIFAPTVNHFVLSKQVDISRVIRLKPDTASIIVNNTIPAGTHVVLVNDLSNPLDSSYNKYIGRMIIRDSLAIAQSAAVLHGHVAPQTFAGEGMFPVLRYALREQCRVSVACYDLRGRLVYSYVNKSQGPGSYALPIPAASWPHGAYCMVFRAGNFERKEKVMVVR
jgi:hypothetical protein